MPPTDAESVSKDRYSRALLSADLPLSLWLEERLSEDDSEEELDSLEDSLWLRLSDELSLLESNSLLL